MKDVETKLFWLNNIFGSFVLSGYFFSLGNGIGLLLGCYFIIHLLCACCCISNDRKLALMRKEKENNK